MKKLKQLLAIVLGVFVVIAAIYLYQKGGLLKRETIRTSDLSLLQENLVELSEWTTLKYEYSNVIISRTEKKLSLLCITDVNYAEAIKLIDYSGYLKAGTDLSKAQLSYDEVSNKLLVRVSKSRILDNVVETEKTRVEDIKGNLFSDYPTQIVFDEINTHKKQLEEEKISEGFLEEADIRIRQLLTSFLRARGYENITIELF